MQQVDKQMFLCTVHDTTTNQVVVYSITLTLTPQDSTKISDAKI
jgi:hypothetical protein